MSSQTRVTFVPTANKIAVPQRLLRQPYYEPDYPISVRYGTLGIQIAREMISSLLRHSALYNANGDMLIDNGLVANLSLTSVDHQLECLVDACQANDVAEPTLANRTSLSTFISISAVKQALKVSIPGTHYKFKHFENLANGSF